MENKAASYGSCKERGPRTAARAGEDYDKKNKKISLKTCPQVEYQVLSLTNNVVFSGITNDDNPEIRIDTSELIDREYVIVLRKKIEDEDEYEEKRIRFAIGNQNKK